MNASPLPMEKNMDETNLKFLLCLHSIRLNNNNNVNPFYGYGDAYFSLSKEREREIDRKRRLF